MTFIICSFYTKGTGYEDCAKRLVTSLKKCLPYAGLFFVEGIENRGTWLKNVNFKPEFILYVLNKYNMPVLYVDADAVFHKYPEIFDTMTADFAVHYYRGFQLAAGTLFFNNTVNARLLLDLWIEKTRFDPASNEQPNLQALINESPMFIPGLLVYLLQPEYCKIFDLMPEVKDPVIEHFHASRQLKSKVEVRNA